MDLYTKKQIIEEIRRNVDVFIPVPPIRYRIRCPFCGDSQKNPRDAHLYIKCSDDPNEPLLYNCFLANCGAKGRVNKAFMDRLKIKSKYEESLSDKRYNRISIIKDMNINILSGTPDLSSIQVKYIEKRLGSGFTSEDYDRFKIIWNMNSIFPYISSERIKNTLPNNTDSITFISDNKSTLLSRGFMEDDDWKKIKITPVEDKSFYTIKSTFDLFTRDKIVVNIAEGIFDILSVYKNFNDGTNSVFIAVLGPDYYSGIDYAIMKGLIGNNVIIKLYIDNNIEVTKMKKYLKKYKWLFNDILIYQNIMYKDVGVKVDKIKLVEYRA